jgi:hypothetical protein
MNRGTTQDESSPVLEYHTPVKPKSGTSIAARIISAFAGLLFGLTGILVLLQHDDRISMAAFVALTGAAFMGCVTFGLIRVRGW